jgi:hypothetical protein
MAKLSNTRLKRGYKPTDLVPQKPYSELYLCMSAFAGYPRRGALTSKVRRTGRVLNRGRYNQWIISTHPLEFSPSNGGAP